MAHSYGGRDGQTARAALLPSVKAHTRAVAVPADGTRVAASVVPHPRQQAGGLVDVSQMTAVILCGGRGTRARPHTRSVPKPLLEVAGEPVLAHLLRIYARQGVTRFVLSAGYMADHVAAFADTLTGEWDVEVVDTGEDTNTAGRIAAVADRVDETFLANYADGLADVDVAELVAFHASHPGTATLTTVPLPSQYGTIDATEQGRVSRFREKPRLADHRINGGWFVFERSALDQFVGDDLERDVLPHLGGRGDLYAYPHHGFWMSLDTYKDALNLTALAEHRDGAPWERERPDVPT